MCVHVFCAGYTGWMGWLRWAGFLCGPPANFMIYSAKGRGARPPVTTERELHVGLMISPQKCLLWLGLHAARSPPTGWMAEREEGLKRELGWSAWVNTIACHDTFTWGGLWRKRRRGWAGRCIWPSCSTCFKLSCHWTNTCDFCVCALSRVLSFLLSPQRASARYQRQHWNVDSEDDVIELSWAGRGAEIMEWAEDCGLYLTHFSLQVCWLVRVDRWGLGSGCYAWCCSSQRLVGYESPRTEWCHRQGFVNILDKGTKSQGWA